jgi:transcriptional regulator with XRE-family HTH domain
MPENPSSSLSDPDPSRPPDGRPLFVGPPIQPRRKDVVGRDGDLKRLKHRLGVRKGRQYPSDMVYPNRKVIKALREAKGWNIPEFAKEIEKRCPRVMEWYPDIDSLVKQVRRFENEDKRRRTDKNDLLADAAETLGVPIEQIIDPNPPSQPPDQDRVLILMKGWPGVGKSTLAALLALDEKDVPSVFADGVLWVSLGPSPDIEGGLQKWCRAVEDVTGDVFTGAKLSAREYLEKHLRDRRVLLIVDDAWETIHARKFDVGGYSCATLVTSRRDDVARDLVGSEDEDVFELKVLDEKDSFKLFEMLAPDVTRDHATESRALVKDLEGLPLAIQVAGRLLHTKSRVGWDIHRLIAELRSRTELLLREGIPANMRELVDESTPTIAALLELSTQKLSSDAVRDRFADLGAQAPKPAMFDIDDVLGLWEMSTFEEAAPVLEELINVGLMQRLYDSIEGKSRTRKPPKVLFTMHALLVALARSRGLR